VPAKSGFLLLKPLKFLFEMIVLDCFIKNTSISENKEAFQGGKKELTLGEICVIFSLI
jgi:hypothetical protein